MLVLGIESTCDETACSVVRDGREILSNVVASQHDIHAQYGGVFPELASRRHVDVMIPVIDEAVNEAGVALSAIDLIAVAHGPGLLGAILVGLNAAKTLAFSLSKPLIGINHVEAHIYAAIMTQQTPPPLPCLGVVLSGGHTQIVHIRDIGEYELIGKTVDDAIGEAFDKVAKVLGLPYPGGPQVEALAKEASPHHYTFKPGCVKGRPLDFSFSGIKTGVLYAVKGQNGVIKGEDAISASDKSKIAASFQHTVFQDVIDKCLKTAKLKSCQSIIFGGGVTNNTRLREMFAEAAPNLNLHWPSAGLSLDNAAMIAGLGYHRYRKNGEGDSLDLEAVTKLVGTNPEVRQHRQVASPPCSASGTGGKGKKAI